MITALHREVLSAPSRIWSFSRIVAPEHGLIVKESITIRLNVYRLVVVGMNKRPKVRD